MVAYAREFDPQPFHLDEEAGRQSILGGLAASGWYTVSVMMRMTYDSYLHDAASMGAPGVDNVKWSRAVYAGDVLQGTSTITGARPLKSRPDMGILQIDNVLINQNNDVVMTQSNPLLLARRPAEAGS